ncbi:VOC family protein [Vallitalea okinawensis]|uniref:VOC family protein n=1 Tax=Vallitalea okinawensis TaxID=2078660 RepID=UPI0013002AC1|nr:VOC family protein [Vallitalea okinawensis]
MVFTCPTIHTHNLEKTLKFYEGFIGLSLVKRFSPRQGVTILFLKDKEGGIIEIVEDVQRPVHQESNVSLLFSIDDLEKTLEVLEQQNISIEMGPIELPSGEKFVFIKDTNGIEIELMEGINL